MNEETKLLRDYWLNFVKAMGVIIKTPFCKIGNELKLYLFTKICCLHPVHSDFCWTGNCKFKYLFILTLFRIWMRNNCKWLLAKYVDSFMYELHEWSFWMSCFNYNEREIKQVLCMYVFKNQFFIQRVYYVRIFEHANLTLFHDYPIFNVLCVFFVLHAIVIRNICFSFSTWGS